jgi:hypothetical protein
MIENNATNPNEPQLKIMHVSQFIVPVCFNKERTSISVIAIREIDTTTNWTNFGYL